MGREKIQAPKGTRDLLPPDTALWAAVENVARRVFARYGYGEIRTPIFEETELFARGVGESSDIVGKEMYTFADRGGRSVTLRPVNTASVCRAYLEHGLQRHAPLGFSADTTTQDLVTPLRLDHPFLWTISLRAGVTYRI